MAKLPDQELQLNFNGTILFLDHYRKRYTMVKTYPTPYYPIIKAVGPALAGPTCMKYWDPKYTNQCRW